MAATRKQAFRKWQNVNNDEVGDAQTKLQCHSLTLKWIIQGDLGHRIPAVCIAALSFPLLIPNCQTPFPARTTQAAGWFALPAGVGEAPRENL